MNYPVWELGPLGGGFWIALMATVHVFISHFAIGGGFWIVSTELRARRTGDAQLLAYVKSHSLFFLLLTIVLGAITGVGIWWTIALLNPAGTSALIHTFVFGWATEWVCFVGEIVALIVYYRTFDTMSPRNHLILGWFYFAFAWLSLFLINGIIGFMLTPGGWLETGSFWQGFFNPSFWPSLVFRSAICAMLAGLFGLVTGAWQRDAAFRTRVVRYNALWVLLPFAVMVLGAWWYVSALPEAQATMILDRAREIVPYLRTFAWLTPVLLVGAVLLLLRLPAAAQRPLAVVLLAAGFLHLGSFEFIREAGRRPWVIHDHMYSNAVTADQAARLEGKSFLQAARWVRHREVTDENALAAGEELFRLQCSACHSIGGPLNDILPLTAHFPLAGMEAQLSGQGKVIPYMPPFFGNADERHALARFVTEGLHGKAGRAEPATAPDRGTVADVPTFDRENDAYVLLAWNTLGMHCLSDSDPWFVILPPANDLQAQLVRRGEVPQVVTDSVTIRYRVEPAFANPAEHVPFWDHVQANFGRDLAPGRGLAGHGVEGTMDLEADRLTFTAAAVPVVPYPDGGDYDPYPVFTVEARDAATGATLATTRMVAPVSTEMGCKRCHGGPWRNAAGAGLSDETARRVLVAHDRHARTDLLARAEAGEPRLCQSCHADPALNAEGRPDLLSLSAAMHGFHANYLAGRGADACVMCHPASEDGATRCFRGAHAGSLACTDCHGTLEDHALSLLVAEDEAGKPGAARLMRHLRPRTVGTVDEIRGRRPWLDEPDCLTCHVDFQPPETMDAFNTWASEDGLFRRRAGQTGSVQCMACHGATHAVYPARDDHDNLQPLQYQQNRRPIGGDRSCWVCHTVDMDYPMHHPGMGVE